MKRTFLVSFVALLSTACSGEFPSFPAGGSDVGNDMATADMATVDMASTDAGGEDASASDMNVEDMSTAVSWTLPSESWRDWPLHGTPDRNSPLQECGEPEWFTVASGAVDAKIASLSTPTGPVVAVLHSKGEYSESLSFHDRSGTPYTIDGEDELDFTWVWDTALSTTMTAWGDQLLIALVSTEWNLHLVRCTTSASPRISCVESQVNGPSSILASVLGVTSLVYQEGEAGWGVVTVTDNGQMDLHHLKEEGEGRVSIESSDDLGTLDLSTDSLSFLDAWVGPSSTTHIAYAVTGVSPHYGLYQSGYVPKVSTLTLPTDLIETPDLPPNPRLSFIDRTPAGSMLVDGATERMAHALRAGDDPGVLEGTGFAATDITHCFLGRAAGDFYGIQVEGNSGSSGAVVMKWDGFSMPFATQRVELARSADHVLAACDPDGAWVGMLKGAELSIHRVQLSCNP